jgi:hypothetical protein|uniref:Uncharacterized protein n=1 Tax=viral metagenome TaxID=1070528 RepID=A0A6C0IKZ9_9ZZZZ
MGKLWGTIDDQIAFSNRQMQNKINKLQIQLKSDSQTPK